VQEVKQPNTLMLLWGGTYRIADLLAEIRVCSRTEAIAHEVVDIQITIDSYVQKGIQK
jgi:hypothetical protein